MLWRNTSDCRLSPPSHFSFVRKQKLCRQKICLRMAWRNTSDLFSVPPGKFLTVLDIQTVVSNKFSSHLSHATNAISHAISHLSHLSHAISHLSHAISQHTFTCPNPKTFNPLTLLRVFDVCTQSTLVRRWEAHQTTKIGGAKASALRRPISVGSTSWRCN